jgi:hypothetical protein
MTLTDRARFLASGQDDPHSQTITDLCERIRELEALESTFRIALWNALRSQGASQDSIIMVIRAIEDDARTTLKEEREALRRGVEVDGGRTGDPSGQDPVGRE